MPYEIEINNCSATMYNGTKACGAHAGNSSSIRVWIEKQMEEHGNIKVNGWHRLIVLENKENEQAKKEKEAKIEILSV